MGDSSALACSTAREEFGWIEAGLIAGDCTRSEGDSWRRGSVEVDRSGVVVCVYDELEALARG